MCVFPGRPEESVGYPEAGDGGSWESPDKAPGIWTKVLWKKIKCSDTDLSVQTHKSNS